MSRSDSRQLSKKESVLNIFRGKKISYQINMSEEVLMRKTQKLWKPKQFDAHNLIKRLIKTALLMAEETLANLKLEHPNANGYL